MRRASEPVYWPASTRTMRQQGQALADSTEALLARQAHIDQAWTLPFEVGGIPGITTMELGSDER